MHRQRHGRVLGLILVVSLASLAWPGAPARARVMPSGAVAWWRFDPARFGAARTAGAERAAVIALLRAMVASRVVEKESASRVIEGVLAAAEVGASPHTLCLLDLKAVRHPVDGLPDIKSLQMVLEVRTSGDHRSFLRTIKAILIDAERVARGPGATLGGQRRLELPGGVVGAAYSEPGWQEWREVSWASIEGVFLVGLGRGALERWLGAQGGGASSAPAVGAPGGETPDAPWLAHRGVVGAARPAGDVFLEAYLNLDAMRRGFPDAFTQGRTERICAAMRLSNGRDFMLHGRWVDAPPGEGAGPALIALDATWSSRSSAPGAVERRELSESRWPEGELGMAPPPGSYIIAGRVDWRELFEFAVDIAEAIPRDRDLARKRARIAAWRTDTQSEIDAFLVGARPWLVLSDTPTPAIPVPGATTAFVELMPGDAGEEAERSLSAVLARAGPSIGGDGAGAWWLRLDAKSVVRAPALGFAGPPDRRTLIIGWGPGALTSNRERLGGAR